MTQAEAEAARRSAEEARAARLEAEERAAAQVRGGGSLPQATGDRPQEATGHRRLRRLLWLPTCAPAAGQGFALRCWRILAIARMPVHTRVHMSCVHMSMSTWALLHMQCLPPPLSTQLSEVAEAHEGALAALRSRVDYFQRAATEAGKELDEWRNR